MFYRLNKMNVIGYKKYLRYEDDDSKNTVKWKKKKPKYSIVLVKCEESEGCKDLLFYFICGLRKHGKLKS